ncbi:MAG TPA: tetratricopeptide repeat protein [Dehalococcoidia bacterium]|nr:tetratricopeptide repeat protein [Dehalococcoidia bacterium]
MHVPAPPGPLLRFGLFQLDPSTGELHRSGRRVRLQEQPLRVLTLLLERPAQLITREELRQKLWPADTFVDFDDGLNAAVKKLRFALGDSSDNPTFIETIPRRGYRFITPVIADSDGVASAELAEPHLIAAPSRLTGQRRALWLGLGLAAITIVSVAAAWLIESERSLPPAAASEVFPIRSILVLPLKNLSNDPEQQYFADGMTEELITRLASLEGVRVISRTSAMTFRNTDKLLPQIASDLQVDAVVEGSVLHSGNRVRITAQLIHGATDRHLWAESYERDERDVVEMQNEVARDIARNVGLKLLSAGVATERRMRPIDPEAHRAYLLGRYRWHTRRTQELLNAIGDFQRAIAIDPNYALAYCGLADVYLVLPFLSPTTQEEAYPKAKEAAEKAIFLDPALAEAHTSNAYVKMYLDWDFAGAERGFRKAIELNPNYATAHQWYAELLSFQGRHLEALAEIRIALELDPLAAIIHHQAGQTHQQARRYDEAIQEYENAIALDPWFVGPSGHFMMWAYSRQGMLEPAAEMMKRVFRGHSRGENLASQLASAAASGDTRAFRLKQLESATLYPRPSCYTALFHAALRDNVQALQWLNKAYDQRNECILYINVDPEWDHLRSDPRFVAILRKIGLDHRLSTGEHGLAKRDM